MKRGARRSGRAWRCGICGASHEGLATVFGPSYPDAFYGASDEVLDRSEATPDVAFLDADEGPRFFVRGHVVLPVHDADVGEFVWSVWLELSAEAMEEVVERWDRPDRASLPPVAGQLDAPGLPYDPPAVGLRAVLLDREPGTVPLIVLDGGQSHLMVDEQRDGVSMHRVAELNDILLGGR